MTIYLHPEGIYHCCINSRGIKPHYAISHGYFKDGDVFKCHYCPIRFPSILALPYMFQYNSYIVKSTYSNGGLDLNKLEPWKVEI